MTKVAPENVTSYYTIEKLTNINDFTELNYIWHELGIKQA